MILKDKSFHNIVVHFSRQLKLSQWPMLFKTRQVQKKMYL